MPENRDDIAATLGLGRHRSRRGPWIALGLVAALAAGGLWWSRTGTVGPQVAYTTAEVARGGFEVIVTATGTVEPTHVVEVSSELSGTLDEVLVDFNDRVEVGSVLARLDTELLEAQMDVSRAQLAAARARVAQAEAGVDEARENYDVARDLQERGTGSRQSLVLARAALSRALAGVQAAAADLELAQANLAMQRTQLERACICSPIDGIVLDRAVDPGQIVAATLSAPVLFTLAEDLSQMELRVDIDEADIGRIRVGETAEFSVDAYDERRFPAEITEVRFAPQTIDGVVTYKAILAIDNSELLLRPGMTATADIVVATVSDALVVPNAALRYAPPPEPEAGDDGERSGLLGMLIPSGREGGAVGDGGTVWVLDAGTAREVEVETGETDGLFTEILGGEIAEGMRVITDREDG